MNSTLNTRCLIFKNEIMKTINLELSKRLAPYLEEVETEYYYRNIWEKWDNDYDLVSYLEQQYLFWGWATCQSRKSYG